MLDPLQKIRLELDMKQSVDSMPLPEQHGAMGREGEEWRKWTARSGALGWSR